MFVDTIGVNLQDSYCEHAAVRLKSSRMLHCVNWYFLPVDIV